MSRVETQQLMLPGRSITLEVYRPERSQPVAGILYLHEIFGPLPGYREDARELAEQGYLVFLPDLYSGEAKDYCVRSLVARAGRNNAADNPLLQEVHSLLDALKADPACNGKLGIMDKTNLSTALADHGGIGKSAAGGLIRHG